MRSAAVKTLSAPIKPALAALLFVLASSPFAPEASALPGIDRAPAAQMGQGAVKARWASDLTGAGGGLAMAGATVTAGVVPVAAAAMVGGARAGGLATVGAAEAGDTVTGKDGKPKHEKPRTPFAAHFF